MSLSLLWACCQLINHNHNLNLNLNKNSENMNDKNFEQWPQQWQHQWWYAPTGVSSFLLCLTYFYFSYNYYFYHLNDHDNERNNGHDESLPLAANLQATQCVKMAMAAAAGTQATGMYYLF